MAALQVKALAAGLVVVGIAVAAATYYHAQHPNEPVVAKLTGELKDALQPKPDAPKPDAAKPGVPKPEAAKPDAAKPEASKPEASKPAVPQPQQQQQANLGEAPTASKPVSPPAELAAPTFDTVRVEPSGEVVAAGRGAPKANVTLLASGKPLGEAGANDSGEFVIIPQTLAPGSYDLTLRQTLGGKSKDSTQTVAVSVPAKRGDPVVVALAEPGKPTRLMSAPPQAPAPGVANAPPPNAPPAQPNAQPAVTPPAAAPAPGLAIRSVELENGNGFYATGVAAPGTTIQIYLNDAHIAEVVAGPDGAWSVTIKKGLTGGHYAVRADAIGEGKKVVARAEVPFDVPVAMAETPKPDAKAPETKTPEAKAPEAPKPEPAKPAEVAAAEPSAPEAAPAPPSAPNPSEVEGVPPPTASTAGASPSVTAPEAPAAPEAKPAEVPTPRPDIAAAAKAAGEKAPGKAPPVLAAAPPAVPAEVPTPPPAQTNISPARPAAAPPTIAAAPPTVAPPKQAVAPPGPPPPAQPAKPSSTPGANAVIEQVETASVVRGDNLWNISRNKLGEGMRYTQIYAANANQIRNPNLIYPGQVFVMPQK